MKRMIKKAGILSTLFFSGILLSACENLTAVSAVSILATDKTLGDHIISLASNKDCSTVREELGLTYCVEDDYQLIEEDPVHCYRELGKVTCYKDPDYTSPRASIEDKKTLPER